MSVSFKPNLRTYKAEGAIRPYRFVKWGAAAGGILECDANEKALGIFQGQEALASGEFGEVALPGGGALLQVSETVTAGKLLTATADGEGEVVDAANEFYGAVAYEDGAANDIIDVFVVATCESVSTDA